jgi:thymidine kinase
MSLTNSIELKPNVGSIDIIMGCMFSGKSTELIRLANRYRVLDMKVLVINHSLDKRYDSSGSVATHSEMIMDSLSVDSLDKINKHYLSSYNDSHVIIIEEGQFFTGLYDFVMNSCEKDGKHVIVVGLDGDSNRKKFGEILDLIPVCDSVKKLYGLCVRCKDGTKACFTKRLIENSEQVFIGTTEFEAVCRKCYID